jgi:hypothetical protein
MAVCSYAGSAVSCLRRRGGSAAANRAAAGCARASRRPRRRSLPVGLLAALSAFALGGCGHGDGVGALMVDPARYAAYRCKDLAAESKSLAAREKDLRNLIAKADEGGESGAIVGALAYQNDYDTVLEQEKVLERTAAQQNCPLTPAYRSDQTIR